MYSMCVFFLTISWDSLARRGSTWILRVENRITQITLKFINAVGPLLLCKSFCVLTSVFGMKRDLDNKTPTALFPFKRRLLRICFLMQNRKKKIRVKATKQKMKQKKTIKKVSREASVTCVDWCAIARVSRDVEISLFVRKGHCLRLNLCYVWLLSRLQRYKYNELWSFKKFNSTFF